MKVNEGKVNGVVGLVFDAVLAGLAAGLLLFGLYSCSVTPKAKVRAAAESKLRVCVNAGNDERACLAENSRFCRDAGLEASCGADGLWTEKNWRMR